MGDGGGHHCCSYLMKKKGEMEACFANLGCSTRIDLVIKALMSEHMRCAYMSLYKLPFLSCLCFASVL